MKQLINVHRVKCAECREFNAKFIYVTARRVLLGKDEVKYKLLCAECAMEVVKNERPL